MVKKISENDSLNLDFTYERDVFIKSTDSLVPSTDSQSIDGLQEKLNSGAIITTEFLEEGALKTIEGRAATLTFIDLYVYDTADA